MRKQIKMRNILAIVGFIFLLSSCATILNHDDKKIQISTSIPGYVVLKGDTLPCFNEKTIGIVDRKNETLTIEAFNDSSSKIVRVKPRKSSSYWMNFATLGAGFFVDAKTQKKYTYPSKITIDFAEENNTYKAYDARSRKGLYELSISLLPFNSVKSSSLSLIDSKLSSLYNGITVGVSYYHSASQFVNFSAGYIGDYIDKTFGQNTGATLRRLSIDLSNNHRIGKFEIGYGLSMSASAMCKEVAQNTFERYTPYYLNYGLTIPVKYSLADNFAVGITYHPLINPVKARAWDNTDITIYHYEPLLSFNFTYKIPLNKKHNIEP
jgi:hypothetical protein